MIPRDVHPLCHLWPENSNPDWHDTPPEMQREIRRRFRNKRKAWRQKRRGRK
jgi:hypothetical protein